MTNPTQEPETPSRPRPKRYATVNDVFRALSLSKSEPDTLERLQKLAPTREVVRRVIEALAAEAKENFALMRYVVGQGWTALRKAKGIPAPRQGDTRKYAVLQPKIGSPFIRLPVGALGLGKGEKTKATYAEGRIIVERFAPVSSEK